MSASDISKELSHLPIGPWKYFDQIGSTNDLACEWVAQGAPNWSVVVADEQLSGRGRSSRRWITHPGSALAFSVILYPHQLIQVTHFSALGAIAVCQALEMEFSLPSEIKWPNDVLLNQQKMAGVLAEASWSGEVISAIVLGIGVNVTSQSVPEPGGLSFPATCIEKEIGISIDRWKFMKKIMERLINWYSLMGSQEFLEYWWHHLAWKNQEVVVLAGNGQPEFQGRLEGLEVDGALRLKNSNGENQVIHTGDLHLRPG